MRQRRKRQLSEGVEIVEIAKTSVLSFSNTAEYSQSRGNLNRCDSPFLLNEHGDLYFLLHKNIEHIILLNLKYCRKRAQIRYSVMKIMTTKTTTRRTPYVHVVSNCVICHQILYDVVLYARRFLPVKCFPKCYFNQIPFALLQNLT